MDSKVYPLPLIEVGLEVAADLEQTPRGKKCAGCGKPFNAARKWHSVARARLLSPFIGEHSWSWFLCRQCAREAKRNGNTVPDHLRREAEREAALLMATPGGTA